MPSGTMRRVYTAPSYRKKRKGKFQRLKKDVQMLKSGIELKHHVKSDLTTPDNAGGVEPLSLIAQGDQNTDRTGKAISGRNLSFRWSSACNQSSSTSTVRFIIFSDSSQDGAIPTVAEVLESVDTLSSYNRSTTLNRFGKLYDRLISLNVAGQCQLSGHIEIPLKNKQIKYSGLNATQAHQGKNNLYLLILSDEPTNAPSFDFNSMLTYYDA